MSNSVDNRVVQMEFDNKKFEKGVKTTLGSLDKLKKSLRLEESSKGLNELQRTADKFNLESVGKAADQAGTHFTAMQVVAFTALQNITNAAMNAGKRILSALTIQMPRAGFSKYEEKMNAVQTIMFATGKSIEDVEVVLERLMEYTDETSYSFTEMSNSIGKFTSAGVDLDQAERAMEGIANWAASAGVGINNASGAFYNMSQAISAGSMKMQDWKSIINLNMNTRQFKETAIETAEEMIKMGTITRQAANAFKRARVTVDNFDSTLSKGWLSREVMLATLEKYADQTTEFGLRAFKAAQEAKTLTDMIDALKDAVSTGWSKTWEYILGDKEEAAAFFTELTNRFAALADKVTYARNKVLKFWHDNGGRTEFINGVRLLLTMFERIADVAEKAFSRVFGGKGLGKYEKFLEDNLKKYGPDSPLTKTFQKILDDENYSHLGDVLIVLSKRFREWTRSLVPTNDQLEKLGHVFGGVFSIVKLFFIVISSIVRVFKPLGNGADKLSSKILDISSGIGEAIERIVDWIEKNDLIYKSLKKVYDFVAEIIAKIPRWIDKAVTKIEELTGLDLHTKKFETFGDVLNYIVNGLRTVYHAIRPMVNAAWDMIRPYADKAWTAVSPYLTDIGNKILGVVAKMATAAVKVKNFIKGVVDGSITIDDIKDKIREAIQSVRDWWNSLKEGDTAQWFSQTFKKISKWVEKIKNKLQPFFEWLGDKLGGITPGKLIGGGIAVSLMVMLIGVGKLAAKAGGFMAALKGIGESISGFFNGLRKSLKYKVITKLALAISIMAASLAVLALIPKEKLDSAAWALGSLIGLVGIIVLLLAIVNKIDVKGFNGKSGFSTSATAMLEIAAAVLLIAAAMAIIGNVKEMGPSFGILFLVVSMMTAVAIVLADFTNGKSITKGAWFMIAFAFACKKMVDALVILGNSDLDGVMKNIGPLVLIIAFMMAVVATASNVKAGSAFAMLLLAGYIYALFVALKKIADYRLDVSVLINRLIVIGLVAKALTDGAKSMGKSQNIRDGYVGLAVVVASFIGLIFALDYLNKLKLSQDIVSKIAMISIIAIALAAVVSLIAGSKGGKEITVKIAGWAAAILAAAIAIRILKGISFGDALWAAASLAAVIIAIGAAFKIAKTITGDMKILFGMSAAIIAITAALLLLSNFGDMGSLFESAFVLAGVIIALGGALRLASKTVGGKGGNMGPIIAMVAAVAIITAALILLQKYDWQSILAAAGALTIVLLALGGSMAIASKSNVGWGAILAMAVAVIAIAGALWILADVPFQQLIGEVIAIGGALLLMVLAVKLLDGHALALVKVAGAMIVFAAGCAAVGAAMWVVGWGFEKLIGSLGPAGQKILEILEKMVGWLGLVVDAIDWVVQGLRTLFDSLPSWDSIMEKLGGANNNKLPMEALDMSGQWLNAGKEMQHGTELMEDAVDRAGALDTRANRMYSPSRDNRHSRPEVVVPEAPIEEATSTGEAVANATVDAQVAVAEERSEEVANANMAWLETWKGKLGEYIGTGEGLDFATLMGQGEDMSKIASLFGVDPSAFGSALGDNFDMSQLQGLMGPGGALMAPTSIDVSGMDTSALTAKISEAIETGGAEGAIKMVESLSAAIETSSTQFEMVGTDSATKYFTGFSTNLAESTKQLINNIILGFQARHVDYTTEGNNATIAFINGLIEIEEEVKTAGAEIGAAGVYGVTSQIGSMQQLGRNFAIGMATGMNAAGSLIYQLAYSLGLKAVQAIKNATKTASPSKEAMAVGNYFGEGFAIGMDQTAHMVEKSSGNVGLTALKSLDSMLGMIEARMNADSVFEPKIRPVLDLTNLTGASDKVNALLNANPMTASTALGYASQMQAEIQRLSAMNEQLQKNQNGSPTTVNLNVTTQELSNSTVDYLVNRVNKVLGGRV